MFQLVEISNSFYLPTPPEQLRSGHTENARHLIALVFGTMVTWTSERRQLPPGEAQGYELSLLEAVVQLLTNLRVWDEQLIWHEMCALAIFMMLRWIDDPSTEVSGRWTKLKSRLGIC